jgi:signal transduction histidine kinase
MTASPAQPFSIRSAVLNSVLALALLVEMEFEAWTDSSIPGDHRSVTAIVVVFFVLPVLIRTRWPGTALVCCAAVAAIQAPLAGNVLVGMTGTLIPPLLLAYTLGARRETQNAMVPLALATSLLWVGIIVSNDVPEPHHYGTVSTSLALSTGLVVVPWVVGQAQRRRDRRIGEFCRLVAQAEEQAARARHVAAASERLRIGAELHDLIAQNISAISLQATGISSLIASDANRARKAMLAIERSGREALDELRHAVSLLRTETRFDPTTGAPGLAQLDRIIATNVEEGRTCEVETKDCLVDLDPGIELLAYRFIEIALSAAAGIHNENPTLLIDRRPDQLSLCVVAHRFETGPTDPFCTLAEGVALYGGTLRRSHLDASCMVEVRLPCHDHPT